MSDHGTTSRRFGQRALTAASVLAIAATGAAWSGCGDDTEDEINNASQQAEDIGQEAQEKVQEGTEEAQQQIEEGTEEAQDTADQATEDAQDQAEGAGNGY